MSFEFLLGLGFVIENKLLRLVNFLFLKSSEESQNRGPYPKIISLFLHGGGFAVIAWRDFSSVMVK